MAGASTLRNAVEAAGSRLEMSVRELRDSFGISSLTVAGRERIARELGARGMRLEPSLARLGLDDRVTIVGPRPRLRLVPPPADPEPGPEPAPAPSAPPVVWERPRRPFWSNRRRAVMAGLGVGLLVVLLAAVFGWDTGKEAPEAASDPAPVTTVSAAATAGSAAAADGGARAEAAASLGEVDDALTRDDTGSARRLLSSIDPAVLDADAVLAGRARILLNRVRLTQRYLGATSLADAGRYRRARETMLALIPFRDAGVRARLYAVEIAKGLVARARTEVPVSPGHALELLDEAEEIAPSLSSISEVRTEAGGVR